MMKPSSNLLRAAVALLCLSASGCVCIHSGSISQSAGAGTAVDAESSDYGILHLTVPRTLTSDTNSMLASKCQSGMLSGVTTELTMREWLLIQYYTVDAAAACK